MTIFDGKSLPPHAAGPPPFTRPRAATPSNIVMVRPGINDILLPCTAEASGTDGYREARPVESILGSNGRDFIVFSRPVAF